MEGRYISDAGDASLRPEYLSTASFMDLVNEAQYFLSIHCAIQAHLRHVLSAECDMKLAVRRKAQGRRGGLGGVAFDVEVS